MVSSATLKTSVQLATIVIFGFRTQDCEFATRKFGPGVWNLESDICIYFGASGFGVWGFVIRDQRFSISGDFRF